jgi:solute carrier family 25 protein 42
VECDGPDRDTHVHHYFAVCSYTHTHKQIQHMTRRDLTTPERMQCGAFAGLVAQTLTYPIEVIRRRMQTIGLVGNDTALGNLGGTGQRVVERPLSLGATINALYVEQGVRGFFKGVSMNWLKGPIAFSISFTAFESFQTFMETESERALKMPRRYTSLGKGDSSA